MKRREFIALLGCVAAWPLAARAQQTKVPVIGFLERKSARDSGQMLAAFHRGLTDIRACKLALKGACARQPVHIVGRHCREGQWCYNICAGHDGYRVGH